MKIKKEFYRRDGLTVAKDLLGKVLCRKKNNIVYRGRIVEVEAYLGPEDRACHGYNNRKTQRTSIMYREGGYAYVYMIYGMYYCLNIVTGKEDIPEAVLIRALEPLDSIDDMKANRKKIRDLTNGPGKLCQALSITKRDNGSDLTQNESIWVEDDGIHSGKIVKEIKNVNFTILKGINFDIVACRRIGIDYAKDYRDKLWRFYIKDNPCVSKKLKT